MERIKWIDIAKGWGIILVICGHVGDDYFTTWLYTFHIPLFFFLSGYFFNPSKSPSEILRSKVKSLLLPYVTLGMPLFFINLYFGFEPIVLLKGYVIQQRASTLWFIAALFMQFVIAYILYNVITQPIIRWVVISIITVLGVFLWHNDVSSLPWNVDVSLVTLPFFCIGYYLCTSCRFNKLLNLKNLFGIISFFLIINVMGTLIMCLIPYPLVDIFASHFSFEPLAYITAMAGILALCFISRVWSSKYIAYIGRNSLVFFVWQQDIAIMPIKKFMEWLHIMDTPTGWAIYARNIIIVAFSLIILTLLNEIIIKTKLRVLIGK